MKSLRWIFASNCLENFISFFEQLFAKHEDDQVQEDQNWCSDETQVNIPKGSNGKIKNFVFLSTLIPENTFVAP